MNQTLSKTIEELIDAVNKADSADKLLETVEDLAEVRSPQAIPTLIEVLGFNNPGAAVAAVEGLIDIGEPSVPYILNNLDDYNYGARAWAIRVFAGVGDPQALDLLIKAATSDFSLSVRRAATRGLGFIKWSMLSEGDVTPNQEKVFETLAFVTQDGEWVVRYASIVALEQLSLTMIGNNNDLITKIESVLKSLFDRDSEIAIQARIQLALSNLETAKNK